MLPSSRTPEGTPNRCPICGASIVIEPSKPFGDAPCPACGSLLWFATIDHGQLFFDAVGSSLVELLAERFDVSPESIRGKRLDELDFGSLDVVEILMEIEEEFGADPN